MGDKTIIEISESMPPMCLEEEPFEKRKILLRHGFEPKRDERRRETGEWSIVRISPLWYFKDIGEALDCLEKIINKLESLGWKLMDIMDEDCGWYHDYLPLDDPKKTWEAYRIKPRKKVLLRVVK